MRMHPRVTWEFDALNPRLWMPDFLTMLGPFLVAKLAKAKQEGAFFHSCVLLATDSGIKSSARADKKSHSKARRKERRRRKTRKGEGKEGRQVKEKKKSRKERESKRFKNTSNKDHRKDLPPI